MKKIREFLSGKKTYIVAILAAIYGVGIQAGWWQHYSIADFLLLGTGAATLRAAISKAKDEGPTGGNAGNLPGGQTGPQ